MWRKGAILATFVLLLAYFYGASNKKETLNGETIETTTTKQGNERKRDGRIVNTSSGAVKGTVSFSRDGRAFNEWLGIPYARPPINELRYARPEPVEKWEGVRDATEYGSECAQVYMVFKTVSGKEDCLFLNIHVPVDVPERTLFPVLVWIHGGYFGGGASNFYRPDYFMDKNVVLVTLNYRLGALGFLNSGSKSARGNMGLADQNMAIKWISQNIREFGGNPDKIVIFGESSGGASVHYHLLSQKLDGIISAAVSQSGVATNPWAFNENPIDQAKTYAKSVNCPTEGAEEMVKCLRTLDVAVLLDAHKVQLEPLPKFSDIFVPTIETILDENTFLSDHPAKLMEAGNFTRVPWLTGYNQDEGIFFLVDYYANETVRQVAEKNWPDFAESLIALSPAEKKRAGEIRDFHFEKGQRLDSPEAFDQLTFAVTEGFFLSGITQAWETVAKTGTAVYPYNYNKIGPSFFNLLLHLELQRSKTKISGNLPKLGVSHCDDLVQQFHIPHVFHIDKEDPNYKFSKDFVRLFVDFATDPSTTKFRGFPLHKLAAKVQNSQSQPQPLKVLEINDVPKLKELSSEMKRLEFWKQFRKFLKHEE